MNKFRNKGVSFFELVIAVAIFGILIIPITTQLIQALKTSEKSSVAQSKYEFAENLMENIKNVSMDTFLSDEITKDAYIDDVSTSIARFPKTGMHTELISGTSEKYSGCVITGETQIGTGSKAKKCYYAVEADNKAYADKAAKDSSYSNPNDATLAMIESLDSSKVALINGTIGNYDNLATNTYMSKKLDLLKIGDRTRWEQYTKQQADIVAFPNDKVTRVIEVSVSSKEEGGKNQYTVECKLRYKDNSEIELKEGPHAGTGETLGDLLDEIVYVPYTQTFETKELPSIYLMYNPCLYNNSYMYDDYIVLDTSGLKKENVLDEDGNTTGVQAYPQVNLFVVETSEKYSEQTAQSYALVTVAQNKALSVIESGAKTEAISKANAVTSDTKSDAWMVAYDKAYDTEYERLRNEQYDTKYAEAYKEVSEAVSKNDNSNALKTEYDKIYNEYMNKNLISTASITKREETILHVIGKTTSGTTDTKDYVHVYHNFMDDNYTGTDKRTKESQIKSDTQTDPITSANSIGMYMLDKDTQIKYITEAITEASLLYDVKVYISDEPFITGTSTEDTYNKLVERLKNKKPMLSGTKGGN